VFTIGEAVEDILERVQLKGRKTLFRKLVGLDRDKKTVRFWSAAVGPITWVANEALTSSLVSSSWERGTESSFDRACPIVDSRTGLEALSEGRAAIRLL
jgi:hypothetical protein